MSKPDKPGELRDVDVLAVSLVSRAANKHKFAIYKSAKEKEDPHVREPTKEGFFEVCRKFFTGNSGENTQKGIVSDQIDAEAKAGRVRSALDALQSALFSGQNPAIQAGDWKLVKETAAEFAQIVADIADSDETAKAAAAAQLKKAGRKICGARMKKLIDIRAALDAIIAEGDTPDETEKGETTDMTKEQLNELLKSALTPLTARLEKLEEREQETEKNTAPQTEPFTPEDIAKAVAEALRPLAERVETLEKMRGISNRLPGEGQETNKAAGGFWNGTILG